MKWKSLCTFSELQLVLAGGEGVVALHLRNNTLWVGAGTNMWTHYLLAHCLMIKPLHHPVDYTWVFSSLFKHKSQRYWVCISILTPTHRFSKAKHYTSPFLINNLACINSLTNKVLAGHHTLFPLTQQVLTNQPSASWSPYTLPSH